MVGKLGLFVECYHRRGISIRRAIQGGERFAPLRKKEMSCVFLSSSCVSRHRSRAVFLPASLFLLVCCSSAGTALAQVAGSKEGTQTLAQLAPRSAVAIPLFGEVIRPSTSNKGGSAKSGRGLMAAAQDFIAEQTASDPLIFSIDFMVAEISKGISGRAESEFKKAVMQAVATHPSLKSSAMDKAYSSAVVDEAFAPLLPTVSGVGDFGARSYGLNATNSGQITRSNGFNAGLSLRQLIYDFGATQASYSAAQARQQQAEAEFTAARADLALRAVSVYVDVLRSRSHRILAEQNRNAREGLLQQIRSRLSAGGSSEADVVRTEARYLDSLANLSAMASRQSTAEGVFNEVFGSPAPELLPIPADPKILGAGRSVEELLREFPAANAKEAARLAGERDAEAAKARGLPSVSAQVSHTRRTEPAYNVGSNGSDTTALLVMKYDFYSGGADKARAQQGAFKSARAAFEYDLIARQFERSLAEIRSQVKNGEEVKQARIKAAKASASSMRSINEQFKFNRGSLLDVLKTQEEVYSAGKELVDAVADQIIAKYRLMHLVSQLDVFFGLNQVRSGDILSLGASLDKKGVTRGPLD